MKIALLGETGYVGSAVLEEALSRGHGVRAARLIVDTVEAPTGFRGGFSASP